MWCGCESRVNAGPGRGVERIVSVEASVVLSVCVTMSKTKLETTKAKRSAKKKRDDGMKTNTNTSWDRNKESQRRQLQDGIRSMSWPRLDNIMSVMGRLVWEE